MVISGLDGKLVFLDTAPLIYFIEGGSLHQSTLLSLFDANATGRFNFLSSAITLLEVLVKPFRDGHHGIAQQYRHILTHSPTLRISEMTVAIAERAAALRAQYGLHTPDAIQLATALENGADYFLTNDIALKKVVEIPVITLAELR